MAHAKSETGGRPKGKTKGKLPPKPKNWKLMGMDQKGKWYMKHGRTKKGK